MIASKTKETEKFSCQKRIINNEFKGYHLNGTFSLTCRINYVGFDESTETEQSREKENPSEIDPFRHISNPLSCSACGRLVSFQFLSVKYLLEELVVPSGIKRNKNSISVY